MRKRSSPGRRRSGLHSSAVTPLGASSSGLSSSSGEPAAANILVAVRVRPENEKESQGNYRSVIEVVDDRMLIFDPAGDNSSSDNFFGGGGGSGTGGVRRDVSKRPNRDHKFAFDIVFGPDNDNEVIFQRTTNGLLDTLFKGYNCSVFVYGATGAGKTYTMLGKEGNPGLTFRTVMELYRRLDATKDELQCEVGVSYVEIYNETVVDLINPGQQLDVRENGKGITIPGLSIHKPANAEALLKFLSFGNSNRTQHPTDANAESSRSHAVFQVYLKQQSRSAGLSADVRCAKLSMIDLAGSERAAAVNKSRGAARLREGANINKSLLALGNCINALADGSKYIPYRNSKLTRLLKDSIGGNCRTVMISNVSPSSMTFEDTYNTLKYADRAKRIKVKLKKNVTNVEFHVGQYAKIVDGLKSEIDSWKERANKAEKEAQEAKEQLASAHARISSLESSIEEAIQSKTPPKAASSESGEDASVDKTFDLDRTYDVEVSKASSQDDDEQSTMQMTAETVIDTGAMETISKLQLELEDLQNQLHAEKDQNRAHVEEIERLAVKIQENKSSKSSSEPSNTSEDPSQTSPVENFIPSDSLRQMIDLQEQIITLDEKAKTASKRLQLSKTFAENIAKRATLLSGQSEPEKIAALIKRLKKKHSRACIRERKIAIRREETQTELKTLLAKEESCPELFKDKLLLRLQLISTESHLQQVLEMFSLAYEEQGRTESVITHALPLVKLANERLNAVGMLTKEDKSAYETIYGMVLCNRIQFSTTRLEASDDDTLEDRIGSDFARAVSAEGISQQQALNAAHVLEEHKDEEEKEEAKPENVGDATFVKETFENEEEHQTSPLKRPRMEENCSGEDDSSWHPPTPPKKHKLSDENEQLPHKKVHNHPTGSPLPSRSPLKTNNSQ